MSTLTTMSQFFQSITEKETRQSLPPWVRVYDEKRFLTRGCQLENYQQEQ